MATGNAIEVEGTVAEALPHRMYRVALANGHKVLAHVAGKRRDEVTFTPGEKVILEMSFYDLSQGRIRITK